ncbi:hypothetical protein ABI59_14450 [Acidobacteria bacterium Mor1]|nr:hypothetical protein ABI59_14450 [Acidobacteria bacterium Mor1]
MFSRRTAWDHGLNPLTREQRELRAAGHSFLDLTRSNPTACGFEYPDEAIRRALSDDRLLRYTPEPRGLRDAREAVAEYYAGHGVPVDPDHLVLTASTSEAYHYLFRLLCDPGDRVATPVPSYPLLDFLATLSDVTLAPYSLPREAFTPGEAVERAPWPGFDPTARAVVLVQPHNPCGTMPGPAQRDRLVSACLEHDAALIVDEVFLDYAEELPERVSFAGERRTLTFVTSGLSKIAGLPQLKLGWIHVSGPAARRDEALERLETIADTYLSVNTPVQLGARSLLAVRDGLIGQIRDRLAANRATLDQALGGAGASAAGSPAGWYGVIDVGRELDEETFALDLMRREKVLVHPGFYYDFPRPGYLIVSLLGDVDEFREGVNRLAAALCETPGRGIKSNG